MRTFRFILILLVAFGVAGFSGAADAKTGVILMHGKGGTAKAKSPIGKLISTLEDAGFIVAAPDMAWSRSRGLDKDYEASMADIDEAVKELKAKGATRIVVGGHSMGANAALGYGARRDGIAGILAMAPGHVPDVAGFQKQVGHDYRRAREMVAAGRGDEVTAFNDFNQGTGNSITTKASVYLSWFDPEGPAIFPKNAAALKPGTALMWIVGENDNILKRGDNEDYAFNKAPAHPKNLYVVVGGGHMATPRIGAERIIEWLKGL
ncbi:MAG: alpha/beta hydrolase [Proteobacteria bacterium]|nr:alpha/beta hydrolase [Pseudomonadota bacterium]